MYGPKVGKRHDTCLYAEPEIELFLKVTLFIDGAQYVVYGNYGHALRELLQIPYKGGSLTALQSAFNAAISKARIPV